MASISVHELQGLDPHSYCLLDVRRLDEYNYCNLGAQHIPMSEIPERYQEIPRDIKVIVHCHHGGRSQKVIDYLTREHGFSNLLNLEGGIEAWSQEIDPKVPRY